MGRLPDFLLRHVVSVEPWAGATATGDSFGPAVEIEAYVERRRKLVRAQDGSEVVSETQVFAQLDALDAAPARSRVTLPTGETSKVLAAHRYDGGGNLPTPDHWELILE